MRRWFQNIGYRLQIWMQGRYGNDELSRTLTIASFILLLASVIFRLGFLYIFALGLLLWGTFRCYSKRIDKRMREREAYLSIVNPVKAWFSIRKRMWTERNTHKYFRCAQCKTYVRVPKGKGMLRITCPKCKTSFDKKT